MSLNYLPNFSREALIKEPFRLTLKGYRFEYLAFCQPHLSANTPLVFLGGAFQNFLSFKSDVKELFSDYPVILLDLPSQGNNQQLCPELSFSDFADLLHLFLNHFAIEKIIPIALSYGTAIATNFAKQFPQNVEKLIIGGTTPHLRPTLRHLLESTIEVMDQGDMQTFADGVILNLINFPMRHKTGIHPKIVKSFHQSLMNLTENEKQRYKDNTQRLLAHQCFAKNVHTPSLVFTGEFDNFTTSWENAQAACAFTHRQFAIVKNSDHLASLERRKSIIQLYRHFLQNLPLESIDGISVEDPQIFSQSNKRLEPRKLLKSSLAMVLNSRGDNLSANILDINQTGCSFTCPENEQFKSFLAMEKVLQLKLPNSEISLSIFPFYHGEISRCIFRKGDMAVGEKLKNYLESESL